MEELIEGPLRRLCLVVGSELKKGYDLEASGDHEPLKICLENLKEMADTLRRIVSNLDSSDVKDRLSCFCSYVLKFVHMERLPLSQPEPVIRLRKESCPRLQSRRGKPYAVIDQQQVQKLRQAGICWNRIAESLGVSEKTLYRWRQETDVEKEITDEELRSIIISLKKENPACGRRYVDGEVRSRGFHVTRAQITQQLRRVDPVGVVMRRHIKTKRKVYRVKGPNYLWHIDGNEKLQMYRLYIHGAVDGFSRKVIYLKVAGNKEARTVKKFFKAGVIKFGLPKRVRSDKGRENVGVARYMLRKRGCKTGAFITGRSIHNVRIERLWREVNKITRRFKENFAHLDLNLDDMRQMSSFHRSVIPKIQRALDSFKHRWNYHKISTANNKSPEELYLSDCKLPLFVPQSDSESDSDHESGFDSEPEFDSEPDSDLRFDSDDDSNLETALNYYSDFDSQGGSNSDSD